MSIGERLKQARKKAGISQQALAQQIGIKQPTISQLENGESSTTVHIGRISHTLGVNALWLETGIGEMHQRESVPEDLLAIAKKIQKLTKHDQQVIEMFAESMLAKYAEQPPPPPRKRTTLAEPLHVPELQEKKAG